MKFEGLTEARFIRRYQRFKADLALSDGTVLTVHCPNTGAMTGCLEPGARAFYTCSNNPARKFPHTLEWLCLKSGARACINTQRPNPLFAEALEQNKIAEMRGYDICLPEQRYGNEGSRIDFLLQASRSNQPDCFVEVKNVTLEDSSIGYFPDAVSVRALKHLRELIRVAEQGYRAVVFFCINHSHIEQLRPADKIQHDYGALLREARDRGVELLAYRTAITRSEIRIERPIMIDLSS